MLKKKDLVKEFELVVKQEIINHNRQREAFQTLINSLEKGVELLQEKTTTLSDHFNSLQKTHSHEIDQCKRLLHDLTQKVDSRLKSLDQQVELHQQQISLFHKSFSTHSEEISYLQCSQMKTEKFDEEMLFRVNKQSTLLEKCKNDLMFETKHIINRRLTQLPDTEYLMKKEHDYVSKKLEEMHQSIHSIRDTVAKERENHWKWEKKIEYLFEQLRRLKEK